MKAPKTNTRKIREKVNGIASNAGLNLLITLITTIATCLTIIPNTNNINSSLADMGNTKAQIVEADRARRIHDTSRALDLYDRIKAKNNEYSFYAALIIGQLHEKEYNDYEQAWENYKIAMGSDDILVLKECLRFVVEQNDLQYSDFDGDYIRFVDVNSKKNNNITIVTDLLNKIYSIDPSISELLDTSFPVSLNQAKGFLSPDKKWKVTTCKWEYVSTIITTKSSEAKTTDNEKVVLYEMWDELPNSNDFTTITYYKYFKYKKVESTKECNLKELLSSYVELEGPVYLSEIVFDKE